MADFQRVFRQRSSLRGPAPKHVPKGQDTNKARGKRHLHMDREGKPGSAIETVVMHMLQALSATPQAPDSEVGGDM